jgi:hypothetical protein
MGGWSADPGTGRAERRRHPRVPIEPDAPDVRLRLRGTGESTLVNLSRGGALVETRSRLLPGSACAVHWSSRSGSHTLDGHIVRSDVFQLVPGKGPLFRTAIAFQHEMGEAWVATTRAGTYYPW